MKTKKSIDYKQYPFSDIYGEHAFCEKRDSSKCPVCGDTNITYGKFEFDEGDYAYFKARCSKGHKFEEWYSLDFAESVKRFPNVPEEAREK